MKNTLSAQSLYRQVAPAPVARLLTLSAALLACVAVPFAQESPRSNAAADTAMEVLALEREIEAAVLRADVAFLDRVCASDFTYTHGDGWTHRRRRARRRPESGVAGILARPLQPSRGRFAAG